MVKIQGSAKTQLPGLNCKLENCAGFLAWKKIARGNEDYGVSSVVSRSEVWVRNSPMMKRTKQKARATGTPSNPLHATNSF
jgi:hypothetical protein